MDIKLGVKKVLLYVCRGGSFLRDRVRDVLNKYGIMYHEFINSDDLPHSDYFDALFIVGTDRDLLETLQHYGDKSLPIFHINPPGYNGFFASIEWSDLEKGVKRVASGDYEIEEYMRFKALIDDSEPIYGLNELALFSSRSAVLINYVLRVNDEVIWRDTSDGVIIATPVGSTAYAYSAGGPIVMRSADVFVIVPVNTLNPMRRPLIVPASSRIVLSDITSSYRCEVVVDGVIRKRVYREVVVSRAEKRLKFIKLGRKLSEPIEKKTRLAIEDQDIPPSAKYVYKMLEIYGEATVRNLVKITGLPERTIRYALSILIEKGLVKKIVNLRDTRQRIYHVVKTRENHVLTQRSYSDSIRNR